MEMALDSVSVLRLPEFVKNFTERVAGSIGAKSAILAWAQGISVESVGFCGRSRSGEPLPATQRCSFRVWRTFILISKLPAAAPERWSLAYFCAEWQNVTLVRLEGADADRAGGFGSRGCDQELSAY